MDRRAFLATSAALLAAPVTAAQSIPVDDREVVELATALARIPSFTTEEQKVAGFLHDFFRREGLESQLMEVDPGRVQVVARLPGSGGGRSLMLNGHIDIDPPGRHAARPVAAGHRG